jgi:hypothetical protein
MECLLVVDLLHSSGFSEAAMSATYYADTINLLVT